MYIKKEDALLLIEESVKKHTEDYLLSRFKRRATSKLDITLIYALKIKNDEKLSEDVFSELVQLGCNYPGINILESEVVVEDKKTVDLMLVSVNTRRD